MSRRSGFEALQGTRTIRDLALVGYSGAGKSTLMTLGLDEPAAALDADAEHRLFQQFRELAAGKTALVISHRVSTARMADLILALEGGRIIEAGSHDELLALGGRYAALYELQAGRYQ